MLFTKYVPWSPSSQRHGLHRASWEFRTVIPHQHRHQRRWNGPVCFRMRFGVHLVALWFGCRFFEPSLVMMMMDVLRRRNAGAIEICGITKRVRWRTYDNTEEWWAHRSSRLQVAELGNPKCAARQWYHDGYVQEPFSRVTHVINSDWLDIL